MQGEMRIHVSNGECPGGNKSPPVSCRREGERQQSRAQVVREATAKDGTLTAGRVSQRERKRNVCIV